MLVINTLQEGFVAGWSLQMSWYQHYRSFSNALTMAALHFAYFGLIVLRDWTREEFCHEVVSSLRGKANFCKHNGWESKIKTLCGRWAVRLICCYANVANVKNQSSFRYSERLRDPLQVYKRLWDRLKDSRLNPALRLHLHLWPKHHIWIGEMTLGWINSISNPDWGDWWDQTSDTWIQVAGGTVVGWVCD